MKNPPLVVKVHNDHFDQVRCESHMVPFAIACLLSLIQCDYKVLQSHVSFMIKIFFFKTKVVVVNLKIFSIEMNKYLTLVNTPFSEILNQ
jgi:hypothetical protein